MIEYRTEVSVVETKEKQFGISLLLILSIFLGVCFGSADRDFPHTARYEFSQNKAISYNANDGVANSAEMLEARSAIELINDTVRHSTGKNSRSLARLLLLVVAVVIFSTSYFIVAVKWTHIPILRKKAIELNYIHNKDGKK